MQEKISLSLHRNPFCAVAAAGYRTWLLWFDWTKWTNKSAEKKMPHQSRQNGCCKFFQNMGWVCILSETVNTEELTAVNHATLQPIHYVIQKSRIRKHIWCRCQMSRQHVTGAPAPTFLVDEIFFVPTLPYWWYCLAVLKQILFCTNICRNSSAEYLAEPDIEKFQGIRVKRNLPFSEEYSGKILNIPQ